MTALNGNNAYLSINGIEVQSKYKTVKLEPSIATIETTRGAGTAHVQRATGLQDTKLTVTVGYDVETIQTQIGYLKPGKYTVIYGPEGNGTGKPRHQQEFIMTGAPFEIKVDKSEVVFEMSLEGSDAPVADMFSGAVF